MDYTVMMSPTTDIINLRGREVPVQFTQVAGSVQVTRMLSSLKTTAQTVLVPTNKDRP